MSFETMVILFMSTFALIGLGAIIYDYFGRKAEKNQNNITRAQF